MIGLDEPTATSAGQASLQVEVRGHKLLTKQANYISYIIKHTGR